MTAAEAVSDPLRGELDRWLSTLEIHLNEGQWKQIGAYLHELEAYNEKTNLTADSGDALLFRHVADGLAAIPTLKRLLSGKPSPQLLDLGSGGGFVGICIKIAWPETSVTLMESSRRKFQFLNWASAQLKLPGLKVVWKRAFGSVSGPLLPNRFDAVVARALAQLPEALRLALPLATEDGVFVAYQSSAPNREDSAFQKTLNAASADLLETAAYRLPRESVDRHLAVFKHRRS